MKLSKRVCKSRYNVGDLVQHQLFNYRGVIMDVDGEFQASDEWYEIVAKSRPPKDKPWYHVLVDNAAHITYVAERNLQRDQSIEPITNPLLSFYFSEFKNSHYINERQIN